MDKVQKIREEVKRLQKRAEHNLDTSLTENERLFWLGESNVLTLIGKYIDSLQEEPVSNPIDFEKELYKAFGQVKDFTLGMRIAKWFYDMGKNSQEPVSEELEDASKEWLIPQLDKSYTNYGEAKMMELTHFDGYAMLDAIEFGAKWQKAKDELFEQCSLKEIMEE